MVGLGLRVEGIGFRAWGFRVGFDRVFMAFRDKVCRRSHNDQVGVSVICAVYMMVRRV